MGRRLQDATTDLLFIAWAVLRSSPLLSLAIAHNRPPSPPLDHLLPWWEVVEWVVGSVVEWVLVSGGSGQIREVLRCTLLFWCVC
jgi:hypothetical protein